MYQENHPRDLARILEYLKQLDGLCLTNDLEQFLSLNKKYAQSLYRELASKNYISGTQTEQDGFIAVMIESKGYNHEYQ